MQISYESRVKFLKKGCFQDLQNFKDFKKRVNKLLRFSRLKEMLIT